MRLLGLLLGLILLASPASAHADALADIRYCESGGAYDTNTGNGYYGAYQFSLATWHWMGGEGWPHEASPEEQDYRAWILLTHYGRHHWPSC